MFPYFGFNNAIFDSFDCMIKAINFVLCIPLCSRQTYLLPWTISWQEILSCGCRDKEWVWVKRLKRLWSLFIAADEILLESIKRSGNSEKFFDVFNFFQKWMKTRGIVVKTNPFVSFFGRIHGLTICFWN